MYEYNKIIIIMQFVIKLIKLKLIVYELSNVFDTFGLVLDYTLNYSLVAV